MNGRRVVITGLGAVTPIGVDVATFWESLLSGRCGVGPVTLFDAAEYPTRIAAEVKGFDSAQFLDRKDARLMARGTCFGVAAALMALENSQWSLRPGDGRLGVVSGVSNSPQDVIENGVERFQQGGFQMISPVSLSRALAHSPAAETGRLTGFQETVTTLTTACSSGLNAVGYAAEEIRSGRRDALICAATDALISKYVFAYFCRAGMLTTRNDDPLHASRPFDRERDGGVLGEGAGCLILEELEHARRRDASFYGEILGFGRSGIGYQIGVPAEGAAVAGMTAAMREALATANCGPGRIDYIGCHGCSDVDLDVWETKALKLVFAEDAYRIPMSSIKALTGIPTSAAGVLQLIAALLAFRDDVLPPTMNYEIPDPMCDLDYVPNRPRHNRIERAMVLSHGLNGSDACVIVGRMPEH